METFPKLSDRIKYLLKEFELKMSDLARMGGVKGQTIKNIIDGADTSSSVLTGISTKLEIDLQWLSTGLGPAPKKGEPELRYIANLNLMEPDESYANKLEALQKQFDDLQRECLQKDQEILRLYREKDALQKQLNKKSGNS